jgi:hypothetical protein
LLNPYTWLAVFVAGLNVSILLIVKQLIFIKRRDNTNMAELMAGLDNQASNDLGNKPAEIVITPLPGFHPTLFIPGKISLMTKIWDKLPVSF